jgi:hypothetical protein
MTQVEQDGWHDPRLPEHGLMPFSFVGLSEHAKEAAREYAEAYARKAISLEREACANIAISWSDKSYEAEQIAAEIQARSVG